MADRPILFSGASVRAILDRRKTQTRRVVRPQPRGHTAWQEPRGWFLVDEETKTRGNVLRCPFGDVGTHLWVREAWQVAYDDEAPPTPREGDGGEVVYRATDAEDFETPVPWRPSIHMPRWASRLTLRVTGVRVERVQDITEEDARAEGWPLLSPSHGAWEWFQVQWDRINAKRGHGWDTNPWVWVLDFGRNQGDHT